MAIKDFEIRELSSKFYTLFPASKFPEMLHKQDRPYLVLLVKINNNNFALPFRTNIRHNECYKFAKTTRNTSSSTGIDFTKAVIIHDITLLGNSTRINSAEFSDLRKNSHKIISKFESYLKNYIQYAQDTKSVFNAQKYAFSSLQYFHYELGLHKPLIINPTTFNIQRINPSNEYINIQTGNLPDTPKSEKSLQETLLNIASIYQHKTGKHLENMDKIIINDSEYIIEMNNSRTKPLFRATLSHSFAVYQLSDPSSGIPGAEADKSAPITIYPEMYHKVYEADYNIPIDTQNEKAVGNALDDLYKRFQEELPSDFNGHRIAVGDVIVLDEKAYKVKTKGFSPIKNFFRTPIRSHEVKPLSDKKELNSKSLNKTIKKR